MSRTVFSINGKPYRYARKDLVPTGGRQITQDSRPWQPGDPADKIVALWHPDGPNLFSQEEVSEQAPTGYLGVDYLDRMDSRWSNRLTLGPKLNTVTLTGKDATFPMTLLGVSARLGINTGLGLAPVSGNVSDIEWTQGAISAEAFIYYVRGSYVTKVNARTMAVIETQSFSDTALDCIVTQTPDNVHEVSVSLQTNPYQVADAAPSISSDTWVENTAGERVKVFGIDPQRVVAGELSENGQTVWRSNILTGGGSPVTMADPAWFTVTTITGRQIEPTGFTTDGARWVMGTSGGPYYMDPSLGQPFALLPSLDWNTENARHLSYWEFLGAIIPTRYGIRYQSGLHGQSFGVETFDGNRSPVQGYVTAQDGNQRWHYEAVYNGNTGTTWIVAWRPDSRETRQNTVMSPFVIGKIPSSGKSRAMRWIGTANQIRTTPILTFGAGTNAAYILVGETAQEPDDTYYAYESSGTAYMTEMRRFPHLIKDVEAIEFETAGCTAGRTITVSLVCSGDVAATTVTLNGSTAGVNDSATTNGYQRRLFVSNAGVPNTNASGRRIKPQFDFVTDSSAAAPSIVGPIRLYCTLRPQLIDVVKMQFEIQDTERATAYDQLLELQALQNAAPVLVEDDFYGNTYYARVADVNVPPEVKDNGGAPDRPRDGLIYIVEVTFHRWITSGNGLVPS